MYYTYILQSFNNNSYYIGSCGNLDERLNLHNKGLVGSTKRYKPWTIVAAEQYSTLVEAKKRERQIKSWKKREAIARLIDNAKFKKSRIRDNSGGPIA